MKNYSIKITAALIFTILFALTTPADAQGIFGKIKDKVDKTKTDATKNDPTKTVNTNTGSTNSGATNSSGNSSTSSAYSNSNSGNPALPPTTILKPTLRIITLRDQRYWKQPNLDNFWSWVPQAIFNVTGPIAKSDVFVAEFTTPDGKPWITADYKMTEEVPAGKSTQIELNKIIHEANTPHDARTSTAIGNFGFRISIKNSLQGTNKELYKGSYKVNKLFAGTNHPNFKNQYVFYVEQDWNLPIGYLWADGKQSPEAPILQSSMWFRGENSSKLNAYLFYNGKQISSTETGATGAKNSIASNFSQGDDDEKAVWEHWQFTFYNVKAFVNSGNFSDIHRLDRNPGNYEIKVLRNGDLIRTANFTVGQDGKISDNGVAANNGFGGFRLTMPVKVNPVQEGTVNLQSWKTDAFYGNPLTGFSAQ